MEQCSANKTILITGASGLIGAGLIGRLLDRHPDMYIIGIDNMNEYYDPELKKYRLNKLLEQDTGNRFYFVQGDICDDELLERIMSEKQPDVFVNLAAQAGVRYSIEHPEEYMHSNVEGFFSVLEAVRRHPVRHLIFASSSSVYGQRNDTPFCTQDKTDHPESFYAATKMSNELMAYAYSKIYGIPMTGCRFFTVYGPAGRPDMAYFLFADRLRQGKTIQLYNYGNNQRDFTYIDDITAVLDKLLFYVPQSEDAPYAVYNIGGGRPIVVNDFVQILSEKLKKYCVLEKGFDLEKHLERIPAVKGDVEITCADTRELEKKLGIVPEVTLEDGLDAFAEWYAWYCSENEKSDQ